MLPWLVITADPPGVGRGVRGYALLWFLRTYFGRRRVKKLTPEQFRRRGAPRAETLFIGLPSTLTPDEIHRLVDAVRPRRVVAFDYHDRHQLAWTPEQEPAIRAHTRRYFKPWFEPSWNYDLDMGLLPLRTNPKLFAAIALDRVWARFGRRPEPQYDVAFIGRPNRTRLFVDGDIVKYDQRIEWLLELKQQAPELRLWGGLSHGDDPGLPQQVAKYGPLEHLRAPSGRINFGSYWRAMRRSRVLLAPGGNVPWTYRHYECLYAGGVVVSIDYNKREMLVPLPREGMIHVPDGASVVPAVREALEVSRSRPELGEQNFAHLERYLHYGGYARNRTALIERFTAQLS